MIFSIIVAVSENNVIGLNGDMPWDKMTADLKFFKQKTAGKYCILGRKSYNALGNKTLPGRKFIVVTRDKNFSSDDSIVVNSIKEAMQLPELSKEDEVMILGGGEIYKQALDHTDRVYLTRIHAVFEGDTFFPVLDDRWKLVNQKSHKADEKNPHAYDFLIYERK